MQKKILVLAYTNTNFGDDLFVRTLCQYFPNQQFEIWASEAYKTIFGDIGNLKCQNFHKLQSMLAKCERKLVKHNVDIFQKLRLNKYLAVVYVVGGLFDDDEVWDDNIKKYGLRRFKDELFKYSFHKKIPFFLLGCNLTRVRTANYIEQMKYVLSGLYDVCFRDLYSFNFFRSIDHIRYAPDIVFNYQCNSEKHQKRKILISVWGPLTKCSEFLQWKWAEKYWNSYRDFMVSIVNEFLKLDCCIRLVSLCEREGDLDACQQIYEMANDKERIDIINYSGDMHLVINEFEEAGFVVGTRFHSIIMALNTQCSFFPIIYEGKTKQLLNDILYDGNCVSLEECAYYDAKNVIRSFYDQKIINCMDIKRKAKEQFSALSLFLGENRNQE